MMRSPPGGFLSGGNMFRSMTVSPMQSMLQEVHQMARQRLEAGGAAARDSRRVDQDAPCEFLVPQDIDILQFAIGMEGKLANGRPAVPGLGIAALSALQMRSDGRIMVLPDYVHRLGRRFLDGIVAQIRARHAAERKPFGSPPERQQSLPRSRYLL